MKSASRKRKPPTIIQPVLLTNYTVSYSANRNSHPHTAKLGTGFEMGVIIAIIYAFPSHEVSSSCKAWCPETPSVNSMLLKRRNSSSL